jgi:hypothetical protein
MAIVSYVFNASTTTSYLEVPNRISLKIMTINFGCRGDDSTFPFNIPRKINAPIMEAEKA